MADERKIVENEVVHLDYAELRNTIYRKCKLVYKGGTPPIMVGCDFVECTFVFENEALNTLRFLMAIASADKGGRELVLTTFLGLTTDAH